MADLHSTSDKRSGRNVAKALSAILFAAVLILLDQWTKSIAIRTLMGKDPVVVIPGVLEFVYVENRGAAFGTFQGMRTVFLFLAPAVSLILFVLFLRLKEDRKYLPLKVCFLFIIAGALGNFIDRLRLSYVVDFIYFRLIDFPVFNVADIYVTCSCILLILLLLFKYKEEDF